MRYIGSKATLLDEIDKMIGKHTTGNETTFCDIFAGTGIVARYFKSRYAVTSNDMLHFSYVMQKATIENNLAPDFTKLHEMDIKDPIAYLEEAEISNVTYEDDTYFIAKHYSPHDDCQRMYLTNSNALRIDFIRNTIEKWHREELINDNTYYYLLASLLEGVPYVSNITGTYGAYLKEWDNRAYKKFEMIRLEVVNNERENHSYNEDALELIQKVEGDILYIDPPYNARQYAPNYHLLETISKYDYPEIQGVTGIRPYEDMKSPFCMKAKVEEAFDQLIKQAKFTHIIMSYSSDGLMNEYQIETILKRYGDPKTYQLKKIPYRKYKGKLNSKGRTLYEYLFYIQKPEFGVNQGTEQNIDQREQSRFSKQAILNSGKYIKSPLNYIGGKYKLLPQILPLFPEEIHTFVDLFCGGCNVSVNVQAEQILCNDINGKIIELYKTFKKMPINKIIGQIEENIEKYGLSKQNEEGFKQFRDYYNQTGNPIDLYTLTCYSFNYQFRFNNNLEYNNPFGRNRSQFSDNMRKNLYLFVDRLQSSKITFSSKDFTKVSLRNLSEGDFIYCDPPYYITTGTYNDGNRGFKDWKEAQERALYRYLDRADKKGIKFAVSNVMEHKGRHNDILEAWSKKYEVTDLNFNYSNASYNTSRGCSREVLITNYKVADGSKIKETKQV
ncbi:Dam family site-specific DNA-(adenine-N6)-methyltransferase [Anaerosporobacter faecicola]|uniref:Dam family site-specific DNA-(adenine-N6)-methyltransferase n=1 Tax=Anaerosporobacter faecicola TaxID=2718714 RepID=UPI00143AB208|nr:Dam family site-specific DNA-(adenine-N6)-methyltransferase [Anaerosporobacter faecicola]